jgi:hypothetical protein
MAFAAGLVRKPPQVRMTEDAMQAGSAAAKHPDMKPAMELATGEHHDVGTEDPESDRTILQPTNNPATNQALATSAMPEFLEKVSKAIEGIDGAELKASRDVKAPGRMAEKINREAQPAETLSDYGGAQISVDTPAAKDAVVDAINQAFAVVKMKDNWEKGDPDFHYHSVILQVQTPSHATLELQVVPREMYEVNEDSHQNYEDARAADLNGEDAASERATAEGKAKNDKAWDVFEARTEVVTKNPDTKGGRGQSPEPAGGEQSPRLKTGHKVTLPDGRGATVAYAPPENAPVKMYRFKTDDGKNVHLREKEVSKFQGKPEYHTKGVLLVDLDKTLAKSHGFEGPEKIGPPAPEMVQHIKRELANGREVRIFTARVANDNSGEARRAIQRWTRQHLGQELKITNRKTQDVGEILDDKARHVEPNKGVIDGERNDQKETETDVRQPAAAAAPARASREAAQTSGGANSRSGTGAGKSLGHWHVGLAARA